MDLKCATCTAPVFIMGRTTVFMATGNGPRTVYYAAHDHATGPRPDHPAALAEGDLRAWAQSCADRERAEMNRVRKPEKKERHAERAASYAGVAREGLASPAWLKGEA